MWKLKVKSVCPGKDAEQPNAFSGEKTPERKKQEVKSFRAIDTDTIEKIR